MQIDSAIWFGDNRRCHARRQRNVDTFRSQKSESILRQTCSFVGIVVGFNDLHGLPGTKLNRTIARCKGKCVVVYIALESQYSLG